MAVQGKDGKRPQGQENMERVLEAVPGEGNNGKEGNNTGCHFH